MLFGCGWTENNVSVPRGRDRRVHLSAYSQNQARYPNRLLLRAARCVRRLSRRSLASLSR